MGALLLILCLEGPLQSWGERARWTYRDTGPMPTKSGVIGLLGCAMGLKRNAPQLIQLDKELRMGVRADKPGSEVLDYHTVSGTIYTADGKQRGGKTEDSTIITKRHYLQDAVFMVALEGSEEVLRVCERALSHPNWPIYLGRKSCVPTRPVFETITYEYESIEQALQHYPLLDKSSKNAERLCELEVVEGTAQRQDRYPDNRARMFGYRSVKIFQVNILQEVIA
jgi:CRISPR system Cascade subunit CasD